MKLLHTADWHLGVKTMGKDRLDSQREILLEICEIAENNNIDVVVIAGDIYNTSVPTADAEELFYEIAEKLSNNGDRAIIVVSGNHDDPERLCAGAPLGYTNNIVLAGDMNKFDSSKFVKGKAIEIVDSGYGYVRLKKGNEFMNVSYLPFDCTITETINIEDKTYTNIVKELSNKASKSFDEESYNVFVSHLFVVGSKLFGDRVVSVGDVFAVSAEDLPKADYTALGHIHSAQALTNNVYYSGNISRLKAGDYDVSVNIVSFNDKKDIQVEKVVLQSPEKYLEIEASSLDEANRKLGMLSNKDLVQLKLILSETLKSSDLKQLKKDYPCIVSISLELVSKEGVDDNKKNISKKSLSDKELFIEFYKRKKIIEPRDSLLELFLSCKGGKDETN